MDRLITLGLSDCHIGQSPCPISDNLIALLTQVTGSVDTLIIAGDLFEVWIGDDLASDFQHSIADSIAQVQARQSYFIPGNRDFLLSERFLARAKLTSVPTLEHRGRWYCHGDEYCLDDKEYMAWRAQSRSPEFQAQFLNMPQDARIEMANQARATSRDSGQSRQSAIADVTPAAMSDRDWVHGHTHRPAIHRHRHTRCVMGDWRPDAWVWVECDQYSGLRHWNHGWGQPIPL